MECFHEICFKIYRKVYFNIQFFPQTEIFEGLNLYNLLKLVEVDVDDFNETKTILILKLIIRGKI